MIMAQSRQATTPSDIYQRVHHLEEAFASFGSNCDGAAAADRKVEMLGKAHNGLEARIHELEMHDESKAERLTSLEDRITRAEEVVSVDGSALTARLSELEAIMEGEAKERISLTEELAKHISGPSSAPTQFERLGSASTDKATAYLGSSTSELACALLSRLQSGDILDATLSAQLQTTLSSAAGIQGSNTLKRHLQTPSATNPSVSISK